MSFISAIPPIGGSGFSDHRATSLTGRHPFDSQPRFVGTMKNDSSVFHALGGLTNARDIRSHFISREALLDGALRGTQKVGREALHELNTERPLHVLKNPHAKPRPFARKKHVSAREVVYMGLAANRTSSRRKASGRKTFARVLSDR